MDLVPPTLSWSLASQMDAKSVCNLSIPALRWQSLPVPTPWVWYFVQVWISFPADTRDQLNIVKLVYTSSLQHIIKDWLEMCNYYFVSTWRAYDLLFAISALGVFASWSPCAVVLTGSSLGRFALSRAQTSRGAREKQGKLGTKVRSLPVEARQVSWRWHKATIQLTKRL